jgi:hypothetical protein
MSKLRGFVSALAFAGVLAAVAAAPADAGASKHAYVRSRAYDGLWSVSIYTEAGPCDASYRYPARIVGGRIRQADNDFSYQISGVVISSGAIAVMVSQGGQNATGYGKLRGARGYGRWSIGGNTCYGTWSAMRRASN